MNLDGFFERLIKSSPVLLSTSATSGDINAFLFLAALFFLPLDFALPFLAFFFAIIKTDLPWVRGTSVE